MKEILTRKATECGLSYKRQKGLLKWLHPRNLTIVDVIIVDVLRDFGGDFLRPNASKMDWCV